MFVHVLVETRGSSRNLQVFVVTMISIAPKLLRMQQHINTQKHTNTTLAFHIEKHQQNKNARVKTRNVLMNQAGMECSRFIFCL